MAPPPFPTMHLRESKPVRSHREQGLLVELELADATQTERITIQTLVPLPLPPPPQRALIREVLRRARDALDAQIAGIPICSSKHTC